ncbi:aspartyl protease family protein [uncultured Psychroserpens sp.]|uniref:aspartyl protease family protein n=1 Tax=uncultured Psychroserpens sp. TaxID=255436 RepID=UPI00263088AE|nr:aspartyl protease family protein [uncultured Psychroserpens sp.]
MRNGLILIVILTTSFRLFAEDKPRVITFPRAEILSEHTTRIPFKLIDNLIVIEAELLDRKGNFIIDTGSETLILNKVHFKTRQPFYNKKKETSGVIDVIDNPLEKRLREFIIKDLIVEDTNSDVIDLSHIERSKKIHLLGIIGFDILKDYEVFVDMYLNQITLSRVDSKGQKLDQRAYLEKIVDTIDFKLKKHTIVIEAYVNDQKLKFGLDTGAEYNQLNKRTSKKVLKYFYPSKRLMLVGASGRKIEVLAGKLYRVKLSDNIFFAPMETMLTNLNQMNEAFGTSLDGVLGYEFFRQQRTIINYKKEKLYFIKFPINKQ